jgi:hypothetical protein
MKCPHCERELVADRTGPGMRVRYGREPSFVLAARCPYPRCAQPVFARASPEGTTTASNDVLELLTLHDVVGWSPSALLAAVSDWLWPCALLVGFATIPVFGLREALDAMRCGSVAWLFFLAGSLLATVPVIYFVRGLGCAAHDALRLAARSRGSLRSGAPAGLRLAPDPRTYRSH